MKNYDWSCELKMLEKLNDDNSFNMEFEKIKNIYPIDGCRDVYDFIKENRGLIIVLNKIRYLLMEYAPYSYVKLFLDNDPLFVPQLWLAVRAPKKEFYNGFDDSIEKIESTIAPLLVRLDLVVEFFIYDGIHWGYDNYRKIN